MLGTVLATRGDDKPKGLAFWALGLPGAQRAKQTVKGNMSKAGVGLTAAFP